MSIIPLFTTIPASEIMPIIVIKITNEDPEITIPPNTPIKLKKIATIIMAGFDTELN